MDITITGAAGRLGQVVTTALIDAGHRVRAVDMRTDPSLPYRVHVHNVLDRADAYRAVGDAEAVVHLANYPDNHYRDAQHMLSENTTMNMNVFQAAVELGVRRLMFSSSVQVVSGDRRGHQRDEPSNLAYLPMDGDLPARPGNAYALSKVLGEQMLDYFARMHDVSAIAFRFPFLMSAEWAEYARRKRDRALNDISSRTRIDEGFTYLQKVDAAALIRACLEADLPGYRCYFPTADEMLGQLEVREVVEALYRDVPLKKPLEEMTSISDTSRITADTGWRPMPLQLEPTS